MATATAFAELRDDILNAGRYVVFDDVVPALRRAAASGWRNLIVSNHVPELESLVSDLGLTPLFESMVCSGVVGYEKPHPLLFEEALRRTGTDRPDLDDRRQRERRLRAGLRNGQQRGAGEERRHRHIRAARPTIFPAPWISSRESSGMGGRCRGSG